MLSPEQKKVYQKEYMRKKRSNNTQLDPDVKPVRPDQNVRPLLDPKPLDPVRPLLDLDEYKRGYNDGYKAGYDKAKSELVRPESIQPVIKTVNDVSKVIAAVKRPSYNRPLHHVQCKCAMCK